MPMATEIAMRGDLKLMSRLKAWGVRAGNTEVPLEAISGMLEEKSRALFDSEGKTGRHGAWQELAPGTKEAKTSQALYPEILRATDALYDSLTDSNDPNAIREVLPGFLRFGTSLEYAVHQQDGFTSRSGEPVPARRPLDWTVRDRAEATKIIREWITMSDKLFRVPIRPSMRTFII